VRRLNLFLKGNLDLRDSLHSLRLNGTVCWNGLGGLLRDRFSGIHCRLLHETWTRSDALLAADGTIPVELTQRPLPLGAYSPASQFSQAMFTAPVDAVILSIQPDTMSNLVRHRTQGYLLHADNPWEWPQAEQDWLRASFDPIPRLEVADSMANLERIIERRRQFSDAPILIYNQSPAVPGEAIHCHMGLENIFSTRVRRFNLGLIELSQRTGVSIIDVDSILSRHGAESLKIDALHLNAEGCRRVAEEVVQVLDDLGCLSDAQVA
jgi:hypothetical protein